MSFSGTVESDFMKLGDIPENRKSDLINFAATDFGTIKASLIEYINAVYPKDFNNFYDSELGVMLIDLVSYVGAVTSFKADALANECYISTVKNRSNLRNLLQLIGVALKGPGSASAKASITWNGDVNPTSPQVSSINISNQSRSVSVASPEDENPVSYTLYKLDSNNSIENIQNADDSLVFYGATDSDNGLGAGGLSSVYSKMVLVEGAYVLETGQFGTTETAKTILLSNGPIIENSVRIFVGAVNSEPSDATGVYTQVSKLFSASGPTDRVFEVVYDGDYNGIVVFGDASFSVPPPQNAPFTVSYRVGGGTRGNLEKEALNLVINSTDDAGNSHSWRLENTTVMAGGVDAETGTQAKKFAPYTFKSQDRLVTLEDYIALGNRFYSSVGSTGKVTAVTREGYSSANIIDLFVLEKATGVQLQKASPTFKKDLLGTIDEKKMLTDHVVVNDGVIRTLDLTITLRIDKQYKEIEESIKRQISFQILSFFSVDNMDFNKDFLKVELERKIFQSPQVRFATIDNIPDVVVVDHNEIIQLNNFSLDIVYL